MRQILRNNMFRYEEINIIDDNIPLLEYLKNKHTRFVLYHVNEEQYARLKGVVKSTLPSNLGIIDNPIAAFAPRKREEQGFKTSGGLKISDNNGVIQGSFIVEDERIIYDARLAFYEERDAYVYTLGHVEEYYTTMTYFDILNEIVSTRENLVYMGIETKITSSGMTDKFKSVSPEEMLEYANNSKKGNYVYQRKFSNRK